MFFLQENIGAELPLELEPGKSHIEMYLGLEKSGKGERNEEPRHGCNMG